MKTATRWMRCVSLDHPPTSDHPATEYYISSAVSAHAQLQCTEMTHQRWVSHLSSFTAATRERCYCRLDLVERRDVHRLHQVLKLGDLFLQEISAHLVITQAHTQRDVKHVNSFRLFNDSFHSATFVRCVMSSLNFNKSVSHDGQRHKTIKLLSWTRDINNH